MTQTKKQLQSRKSYEARLVKYGREYLNQISREYARAHKDQIQQTLAKSRRNNPERTLLNRARERCNKSGLEFSITQEDIIIPEICPLLGVPISKYLARDFCPSLDRKDNTKGYTKDNIWVISFLANRMKNTATSEQITAFAKKWLNLYKDLQ